MEITKLHATKLFLSEVPYGACFERNNNYYMVVKPSLKKMDVVSLESGPIMVYVVSLESGFIYGLSSSTKVHPVKAEVFING